MFSIVVAVCGCVHIVFFVINFELGNTWEWISFLICAVFCLLAALATYLSDKGYFD